MKTIAQAFCGITICVLIFAAGYFSSQIAGNKDIGRYVYFKKNNTYGAILDSKTGKIRYLTEAIEF